MDSFVESNFSTLFELVRFRAASPDSADQIAFTYLNDGENVSGELTYAQLDECARRLAARLQLFASPGDRVLLVYPPSLDYIIAFFACVYSGTIAVPALPPANPRALPRLRLIAADAQPSVALTSSAIGATLEKMQATASDCDPLKSVTWMVTDTNSDVMPQWTEPSVCSTDLVFLQYTSGSTGAPKGVMVSNANLLANLALSVRTYGMGAGDVFVSWLPPHHDFGLIGAIIFPVYAGGRSVQFPAAAFLMRPYRWLKLISHYRGRMTGAPNFAYQLCVQRVTAQQKAELDLSCLAIAVNGAERVRAETMRQFIDAFAEAGLRPGALTPAYGMAESVLLVCASMNRDRDQKPYVKRLRHDDLEAGRAVTCSELTGGVELASTGKSFAENHRIAIVSPTDSAVLPDGHIGEIWVSGPSVAQGYWNQADTTAAAFGATLQGNDRAWLRTGDLGFISDEELYVTGRIKEMMIFNGRNVYPQDVELTIERLSPAFRANGCAVFALEEESGTGLVVFQEIESRTQVDFAELIPVIRTELAELHDVTDLAAVIMFKPGKIPRTSSGKLQRLRCKQLFLTDDMDPVWSWRRTEQAASTIRGEPQTEIERQLLEIWKDGFERSDLSSTDNFFCLGGHSLLAAQLIAEVNAKFKIDLSLSRVFFAPTIQELALEVECAQAQGLSDIPAIVPLVHGEKVPLSYAQRRFWFLDQYESGNAFYAVPVSLTLEGALDKDVLERAFNEVIKRHAPLRTVFHIDEGIPYQSVLPELHIPLEVMDFSHLAPEVAQQRVQSEIEQEGKLPFDLTKGPLVRARLLRQQPGRQVLLFTAHHINYDGWSTGVLLKELFELYASFKRGIAPTLPQLPVQYLDYVVWEQERFGAANVEDDVAFWKAHLQGVTPLLPLPTDRPRKAIRSHKGAALQTTLPVELVSRMGMLASERNVTLFMVMAAAMNVLLLRYTGCEDFCIATLAANRPAKTDELIGNFINVVPLRARLQGEDSFYDVLEATKRNLLSVYERQLPFELVLNHVAPENVASYTPYSQVVLNFHNEFEANKENKWSEDGTLAVSGREATSIIHAAFDVKIEINRTVDSLQLTYEYSTDLFDAETITRWADHVESLLDQVLRQPHIPVWQHDMLTGSERDELAVAWQANKVDFPSDASLADLLDRQAHRTPDATAVVFAGNRLSYRQLHSKANQLAHALRSMGVGPNTRIGLLVERSLPMVIGVLAVVKTGAAYIPLDPNYPAKRLQYMLDDSQPEILLTQQHLSDRLQGSDTPVLCIEELTERVEDSVELMPYSEGKDDDLAYLIYTSGSTGQPKGAMVHRRGMLNLLLWFNRQFNISSDDKVLLFSSFSFDLTQKNIFSVLLVGGELHLAPEGYDPKLLSEYISSAKITFLNCAPSAFYPLLTNGAAAATTMRQVFLGGEPINAALLHDAYADAKHVPAIHNTYGPTEASDVVAFYSWSPKHALPSIPIGKAIANTSLYVLDANLKPVPRGVTGELFVGGHGVGLGYLNLPALTAERFLIDPYAQVENARMYRTGDLVRQLPNGELEYIARIDHQVKLRGFRIELGEIEAALLALPEIAHALAVVREDHPGDQRLVAYVVAKDGYEVSAAMLRAALSQTLAPFMVPLHFEQLAAFPLTPNGKVDRRNLPVPREDIAGSGNEEPVSREERALARIWSAVLKRDGIGLGDDFFALGGHSLLATQVASQIRSELDIDVPLRALFEHRTLASLAAYLTGKSADLDEPRTHEIALQRHASSSSFPLSFAQQRLWFHEQLNPGLPVYNLPYAVELTGPIDMDALRRSLSEIVRRHEILRTSFSAVDGEPVAQVSELSQVPLYIRDLSEFVTENPGELQGDLLRTLIQEEIQKKFDLSSPSLTRVQLFKLQQERHTLVITMHHIIADGWSVGVLVRELTTLYQAFTNNQPSPLPELPFQYRDFAQWQRQRFEAGDFAEQLRYWHAQLSNSPGVLSLPTDRPRPSTTGHRGGMLRFSIGAATVKALTELAQQVQGTLFMALAASFGTLLYRYAGQSDICIGTPIANRNHHALEGMVGFFVNTVVLRMRLDEVDSFRGLLEQVRDTAHGAYANQDLPFDELVSAMGINRRGGHTPLFQVMLAMQNAPTEELALKKVAAFELPLSTETAKFDLSLNITPVAERLDCTFEYNAELFDAATIARWGENFVMLLDGIAATPDTHPGQLALLPPTQLEQLLQEFGHGKVGGAAKHQLLHCWFEERAAAKPDAIAMAGDASTITYGELNRRANQLAHYLIERDVGLDARVAVLLSPCVEMLISILGILKAGAAYVPLDPTYPRERLLYVLDDSAAVALITDVQTHDKAMELCREAGSQQCIVVDRLPDMPAHCGENPNPAALALSEKNLAYVIYTSGSTGRPKGVMVEHRNASNLLHDWAQRFGSHPGEQAFHAALWTSPGFDVSIFELFVPLSLGGTLRAVPPEVRPDAERFLAWLGEQEIAFAYLPPFVVRHTSEVADQQLAALKLKSVLVGVEPLMESDLYRLERLLPSLRICNAYGPTEITVYCTSYTRFQDIRSIAPIGAPIANTSIYLLDECLQPVALGAVGEIYIGGKGVARGYLNQPEVTNERFLPDPFAGEGGRMYRSGDLARWRTDGQLQYVGRNDFQVKVRGYRVEPGEVEARLRLCEHVADAAVVAKGSNDSMRLVAYVVAAAGKTLSVANLRTTLASQLADFMVPAAFVILPQLPLNSSGKLDRAALPEPDESAFNSRVYVAPESAVEVQLAALWSRVLDVPTVGRNDNFLELGGHSLSLTKLRFLVKEQFNVNLEIAELYELQELHQVASYIERRQRPDSKPQTVVVLDLDDDDDEETQEAA